MIVNNTIREELWENNLARQPKSGFVDTTEAQREEFVTRTLRLLRTGGVNFEFDRDLVMDVITAVKLNFGRWPEHEPHRTFCALAESIASTDDSREEDWRWRVSALQAFLLEIADQIHDGHEELRRAANSLLEVILAILKKDSQKLDERSTTATYRLAIMLAANFSAIPSRKHRAAFVGSLRKLVKSVSNYDHPFLEDLVLIYDKMNLRRLDNVVTRK